MSNTKITSLFLYSFCYESGVKELTQAFLDHLAVERGLSINTRSAYSEDLAEFTRFLERRRVTGANDVTRDHIAAFLMEQRQPGTTARGNPRPTGLSVRTIARRLATVRMFFRFLLREKLIVADPTQTIDSPRLWKTLPHTLEYREVEALLAAPAVRTKLGLRDRDRKSTRLNSSHSSVSRMPSSA